MRFYVGGALLVEEEEQQQDHFHLKLKLSTLSCDFEVGLPTETNHVKVNIWVFSVWGVVVAMLLFGIGPTVG